MRKRENGFTLIELIAIVVIIAIIALITTPQIIKIIENGKKNAFLDSVNGIVRVVKLDNSKNDFENGSYEIKDGIIMNYKGETLKSEGGSDETGNLYIDNKGNVEYAIHNSKWCVVESGGVKEILNYENGQCRVPEPILFATFMSRGNVTTDRSLITSITFLGNKNIPGDVVDSWDASEEENGSVMAWTYEDEENEGYYKLYIGGNGKVYAPKDCRWMFWASYFSNLTHLDFEYFDTSKTTIMHGMFTGYKGTELDVSNFDTSNVTDMYYMFAQCVNLTELDVVNFDTSNVTTMAYMFYDCKQLNSLNISNFDTKKVESMKAMFMACYQLETLNLSNFDTSKVTDMQSIFSDCVNLFDLNIDTFDTSKVTNMGGMFWGCKSLLSLNVKNFDTSKVTGMGGMFRECSKLETLDLSHFDTSKVTSMSRMFDGCNNLVTLDLSNFDTSNVTTMLNMFSYCRNLTSLNLSSFYTSKVTDMYQMFFGCSKLTDLNISNFTFDVVTNYTNLFKSMPTTATIRVKDSDIQTWILSLNTSEDRPSEWTIDQIITV